MKPKTLTFVEQYLDEEPPEDGVKRFRGITAYLDDGTEEKKSIFYIGFVPLKNKFEDLTHFDFSCSLHSELIQDRIRGLKPKTKEEAKVIAQEIFNDFVYSFCEVDYK